MWRWRTNINLLQQSIFHHTYSQGTSQSGLYPFCQWLPSSINFIENYTQDQCGSRPLSICRGAAGVGRKEGRRGAEGMHHGLFSALRYFFLAARSCSDKSHHAVKTKNFPSSLRSFSSYNKESEVTK